MKLSRRQFIAHSAAAASIAALRTPAFAEEKKTALTPPPLGKAEHCLFIWLSGGMSHLDTFDAKTTKGDGLKKPGCYYDTIETAIPGVRFCEHLPRLAKMAGHLVPLRTVNHTVIDEHAAAVNRMHTGRPVSGSVVYPSIGSIIAHQRKAAGEGVPPYVLIGYPSATRGPGFLGPKAGYVYLTDTAAGPAGLTRMPGITDDRQKRRESLLASLRSDYVGRNPGDKLVQDYDDAIGEVFKLQGGDFMKAFDLASEPGSIRQSYGDEFGQRCMLARRLIQRGVRFVEVGFNLNFVNGAGWDTHNAAQKQQHALIQRLDEGVSALITDLKNQHLLDKTLIVIATEFGRPAAFDAGGGRGHYGKCFSAVLAGGGLRTGQFVGTTDDLAMNIVEEPVSVPDLFATIFATMGINPAKNLIADERPVPITDKGEVIRKLFV